VKRVKKWIKVCRENLESFFVVVEVDKFQLLLSRLIQDKQVLSLTELFFNDKQHKRNDSNLGISTACVIDNNAKNNQIYFLQKRFHEIVIERACRIRIRFNVQSNSVIKTTVITNSCLYRTKKCPIFGPKWQDIRILFTVITNHGYNEHFLMVPDFSL